MGLYAYKNKDGSTGYGIRYWMKGKESRERVGPSKRQAELVLAKRKNEIRERKFGLDRARKPRPFTEHFRHWLDTYACTHCKPSTLAGYETIYRLC